MKTRLTAALSLTGVLVAGSAAALMNTQVLQSSSPASSGDQVVAPQAVTTLVGTTTATTLPVVTVAPAAPQAPATTQAAYAIGDAGVVVLDTAGDVLTLVSVTPNAGWMVVESEQSDAFHAEVKLQSGNLLVEFHAAYLFGVVGTSVESKDLSTPPATAGSSSQPTRTTEHDDDDGEEHDDDHGGEDD